MSALKVPKLPKTCPKWMDYVLTEVSEGDRLDAKTLLHRIHVLWEDMHAVSATMNPPKEKKPKKDKEKKKKTQKEEEPEDEPGEEEAQPPKPEPRSAPPAPIVAEIQDNLSIIESVHKTAQTGKRLADVKEAAGILYSWGNDLAKTILTLQQPAE